jgi:hypothetical protein
MKRRAKRRESGRVRGEHRAPDPIARPETDYPPSLDRIVLQDPVAREDLRRQLIDGTAGSLEPLLWKLAYGGPPDVKRPPLRILTTGRFPCCPPDLDAGHRLEPSSGNGAGTTLPADFRKAVRALVDDPDYQEALERRIADGKAPRMRHVLWEMAEQKLRDPGALRSPLTFLAGDHYPWCPAVDPLRERTEHMLAEQRREEEARAQQAARDKPATATPEEPDPDELEVYRDPPGYEPYGGQ